MYKLMITTLDSPEEGFEIACDFDSGDLAWNWWYGIYDEYPEMTGVWVELQTIADELGIEATANIISSAGEDQWNGYFLDNGVDL